MPKVLFITADQWRGDCLGVSGHPCVKTPALDELAKTGTRFSRHFAQAAPCGPSRASLHTGMYMMNHRSVGNGTPLDPRFTNIALEVRKQGFEPALIGYTDTSPDPRGRPSLDPALNTYCGVLPGFKQLVPESEGPIAWMRHLQSLGYDYENVSHPEDDPSVWDPAFSEPAATARGGTYGAAPYRSEHSDTAFSTDHAIRYIREKAGKDWFLHLSLLRPHPPFIVPAPYHDLYSPGDGPDFVRHADATKEASVHPYAALRCAQTDKWTAAHGLDLSQEVSRRQLRATYWGMMTEVDAHLGRLLEVLRQTGDDEDTLVVFTSDHGEQLLDHWHIGKLSYNDQSFHIPLIVRQPGAAGGRVVDSFTENVDIMPTILDWLGADVPLQCDGQSLVPWIEGATPRSWRENVFYEVDFRDVRAGSTELRFSIDMDACNFSVLRGDEYKYIHFADLAPLLFNIEKDAGELQNLAGKPDMSVVELEQAQRLLSHRMRYSERTWTHTLVTRNGLVDRV
jgi:arylsulfatase A-like enzyme